MEDRIRRSIDDGHARRIGHGTSVAWERDLPGLLAQMRDDGVLVEIALTSADDILDMSDTRHPFALYRAAGVPMCLSTDDEGVSRSNLTMEYVKAVRDYDLDYEAVRDLSRNCLEYSFAAGESLYVQHDYRRVRDEFGGIHQRGWQADPAQRSLMNANPRLALQVRLEVAFAAFETSLSSGFREPPAE
jgi:adenosine deaminase